MAAVSKTSTTGDPPVRDRRSRVAENRRRIAEVEEQERKLDAFLDVDLERLTPAQRDKHQQDFTEAQEAQLSRGDHLELLCECGRADCSEVVLMTPSEHALMHGSEDLQELDQGYVLALAHVEDELDQPLVQTEDMQERFAAVFAKSPLVRPPLDVKTLELNAAALEDEVNELHTDLQSKLGELKRAAGTAALILGVFAALKPKDEGTLALVLFGAAAIPFLIVLYVSLWGSDPLEQELQARKNPGRSLFHGDASIAFRIVRDWEANPFTRLLENERSMASYQQIDRRRKAEKDAGGPIRGHILLPYEDALLARIDRLNQIVTYYVIVDRDARRKLQSATFWLGFLALYLFATTIVISFT
jgi:hypothetical protein